MKIYVYINIYPSQCKFENTPKLIKIKVKVQQSLQTLNSISYPWNRARDKVRILSSQFVRETSLINASFLASAAITAFAAS